MNIYNYAPPDEPIFQLCIPVSREDIINSVPNVIVAETPFPNDPVEEDSLDGSLQQMVVTTALTLSLSVTVGTLLFGLYKRFKNRNQRQT